MDLCYRCLGYKKKCKECNKNQAVKEGYCKGCHPEGYPKTKCPHNKEKAKCKICDPIGHLASIVRGSVKSALKSKKSKHSIEYLGCTIQHLKEHLQKQFLDGMTWENHGTIWEIDHIIPIKYQDPTLKQVEKRLHWTNTQPLWKPDNGKKGNRFIG